ncbi:MAG: response regulator [gamma proteobacterium symbiont of Taylorina sp.]|nr:response regulator [gamma proteobacterium symbiont of Taylorina sp.]
MTHAHVLQGIQNLYLQESDAALLKHHQKADKFLLIVCATCWLLVATASAYFYSTYLLGIISGGLLFLFAAISYKFYSGTPVFRIVMGIILMTYTIISIQQNMGRIEMHFFVFIVLSFLTVYKDSKPIAVVSIYIILHHLLFTWLQLHNVTIFNTPLMIYNYGCSYDIALLHAFYVILEWIILYKIIHTSINNFHQIHQVQKQLLKTNEQLEQTNQYKSQFLANMSHEIRTPMNGVMGIAQLLEETELTRDQSHYVSTLIRSSKTLGIIIDDILDYSKIESGQLHIENHPYGLLRELREVMDLLRLQADNKDIKLVLNIPQEEFFVIGDATRLRQVLLNLLGNAIKFTQHGTVKLTVSQLKQSDKEIQLKFIISDTGIGIAQDKLEHIFTQFSQADSSTTRKFGGTGLGLTISKQLVSLMGGELKVSSQKDKGSEFYFTLTMIHSDKPVEKSVLKNDRKQLNGLVLLVEDDRTNRLIAEKMLAKIAVDIIHAENGLEAINIFAEHDFDLVLMDMQMPVMDGVEATLEIRSKFPQNKTPIIAMTANVLSEHKEQCFAAGMNGFLTKPVKMKLLHETLSQYLTIRQ